MANYMEDVAKLLGVEIGEEFEIQYPSPCDIKTTAVFSANGFNIVHTDAVILQPYWKYAELHALLEGTLTIKRKPWKPKSNDLFWFVNQDGDVTTSYCKNSWHDTMLYKLGNCYRTREEAKANCNKWISFYASDEVLEV